MQYIVFLKRNFTNKSTMCTCNTDIRLKNIIISNLHRIHVAFTHLEKKVKKNKIVSITDETKDKENGEKDTGGAVKKQTTLLHPRKTHKYLNK